MSSEQNMPEVHEYQGQQAPPASQDHDGQHEGQFAGSNASPGMGQSKSSRRRRRKRNKGKGSDGPQAAQPNGGDAVPGSVPSLQAAAPQGQPSSPQGNGQGNGQYNGQQNNGQQGKRWKKKFRDRQRGSNENPGNVASPNHNGNGFRDRGGDSHQFGNVASGFGQGGGKRKGKQQQQRGPRSFVGPMDHSYRVANGNFADAPPSTIETHGNGNFNRNGGGGRGGNYTPSDSQPIDYSQGRAIPIPEDAPTKIFFFIEDLFFTAKIQETARKLGVKVAFVKNDKEAIAGLVGGEEEDLPGLIVFDLNNANAKPLTLIPKLKSKLKKHTSIIGFLSHLQGDLKAKAVEAGCDTVMPRSAFSQNLPNLLRRYGTDEEEETNFNQ